MKLANLTTEWLTLLSISDEGEIFGWGNSEYRQLTSITDEQQVHMPTHLPLPSHIGKVKDIASSGSSCFILNGLFFNVYLPSFTLLLIPYRVLRVY